MPPKRKAQTPTPTRVSAKRLPKDITPVKKETVPMKRLPTPSRSPSHVRFYQTASRPPTPLRASSQPPHPSGNTDRALFGPQNDGNGSGNSTQPAVLSLMEDYANSLPQQSNGIGFGLRPSAHMLSTLTYTDPRVVQRATHNFRLMMIPRRASVSSSGKPETAMSQPTMTGVGGTGMPSMPINTRPGASANPRKRPAMSIQSPSIPSQSIPRPPSQTYTSKTDRKVPSGRLPTPAASKGSTSGPPSRAPNPSLPVPASQGRTIFLSSNADLGRQLEQSAAKEGSRSVQPTSRASTPAVSVSRNEVLLRKPRSSLPQKQPRKQPRVPSNATSGPSAGSTATASRRRRVIIDDEDEYGDDERSNNAPQIRTPSASSSEEPILMEPKEYVIPAILQGMKPAMGEADWKEYVELTENFVGGAMLEWEFDRKAEALFRVGDEGVAKRIKNGMLKMVRDAREDSAVLA